MNILLTSAGRRTYMVNYFKEALRGEGLVYVANSAESPAMRAGDVSFLTPLIYSEEYIPFLLEKCREYRIDLLVSLFDIDLPVLAAHSREFEEAGTTLAVSDSGMLSNCNDKYNMFLKLREAGLPCPKSILDPEEALRRTENGDLSWPLLLKPRYGMGSVGLYRAYRKEELTAFYGACEREINETYLRYESRISPGKCVLIQEVREGCEYGLDVISDLKGHFVTCIARRKLGMRSGETDEAIVLGADDPEYAILMETGEKLARAFGPRGLIDVDIIMDGSLTPYIIDINARFGGGYPFSHLAGADVPRAYVLWMQGRDEEARACCRSARAGVRGYKEIVPVKR